MEKYRESMAPPRDKENTLTFLNDSVTPIGSEGQSLQDIIDGAPVPDGREMLPIDEVVLLWAYLPEERRMELSLHIDRLKNSITDKPVDFNEWQKLRNAADPQNEEKNPEEEEFKIEVSALMMATLAQTYREWLVVFNGSGKKQIKLRRVAAAKLRGLANSASEINVAKRKYDEAFK